ncbi:MAG: amidohydrolase family protein [Rubrobacteraceae bacterium]
MAEALELGIGVGRSGVRKKVRVIDVDVHEAFVSERELVPYLEEPWRGRVAADDGWKGIGGFRYSFPQVAGVAMADAVVGDGSPAGSSYGLMREQLLDRYGMEAAILFPSFQPSDMKTQPEFAVALARAYNDWLIENWLEKDERLRGTVTVAAQRPVEAAREIDRVGAHPQIVQVGLPASSSDVFGRDFYHPVFAAAQRNGLVVGFHQSNHTGTAVGHPPYYIEWHTNIGQAWQCQLVGLVAHGIFDRFEELKVAMIESSWTWVPSLIWRFDHNYRSLRREVPWVKGMPSQYIRERVRFSTQPMEYPEDPADLYRMFEMIGTDEFLMFSTDYPHWDFDSPRHVLPKTFPKDLRRKILSENARSFYDL